MAKGPIKVTPGKLANPGERSRLADKYLSKSQLAQRLLNKRLDATVAPGLKYRDVARQANAEAELAFGPQEKLYQQQQVQNRASALRDQDFFKTYLDTINQAKAQAAQNYQGAITGVQNLGSSLDASSAKNWGAQQSQMQADAATRGAQVDPGLAQTAQNASAVRTALTGSYGAMLTGQGANAATNFGNQSIVGVQQRGEQGRAREQKGTDLAQKVLDLAGEKGLWNVQDRAKITGEASKNALQNALTRSTIKDRAADNKRADKAAGRSASEWNNATNTTYGISNGAVVAMRKTPQGKAQLAQLKAKQDKLLHPGKGGSSTKSQWLPTAGQNTAKTNIDNAVTVAKDLKAKGYSRAEAAKLMVSGRAGSQKLDQATGNILSIPGIKPVTKDYASTALDVAYAGHIAKGNVNALHGRKIQVKKLGYGTK